MGKVLCDQGWLWAKQPDGKLYEKNSGLCLRLDYGANIKFESDSALCSNIILDQGKSFAFVSFIFFFKLES